MDDVALADEGEIKISANTKFFVLWASKDNHFFSFEDFAVGSEQDFEKKRDSGKCRSVKLCFDCAKIGDYALGYQAGENQGIVCISSIVKTDAEKIIIRCLRHFTTPVTFGQITSNPVFQNNKNSPNYFSHHILSKNHGQGTTMDFVAKDEFLEILKMANIKATETQVIATRDYLAPLDILKKTAGLMYRHNDDGDVLSKDAAEAKNIFLDLTNAVRANFKGNYSNMFVGTADNRWQHSGHYQKYYWDPMYLSDDQDEPLCLSITASDKETYSVEIQMTKPAAERLTRAKDLCKKLLQAPCPDGFAYSGNFSSLVSKPTELIEEIDEAKSSDLEGAKIIRIFTRDSFGGPGVDIAEKNARIVESLSRAADALIPLYLNIIGRDLSPRADTEKPVEYQQYGKEDFLNDVFVDSAFLDDAFALLHEKMNIILYGAPGVGKTYLAKRLAYADMGFKKPDHVEFVQFHQGFSYEDFVEGYKPKPDGGFNLVPGIFYTFAKKARENPDESFYLIIDEINRGNISKIFGELLMLIESDKRTSDYSVKLAYGCPETGGKSDESFYVPANLYLIGMMNSADRSLARMDYALRRRFSFIDVKPAFENEKFKARLRSFAKGNAESLHEIDRILDSMRDLNSAIASDSVLGPDFQIGHSYFIPSKDPDLSTKDFAKIWLQRLIKYDILPLLKEYAVADDLSADVEKAKKNLENYLTE